MPFQPTHSPTTTASRGPIRKGRVTAWETAVCR